MRRNPTATLSFNPKPLQMPSVGIALSYVMGSQAGYGGVGYAALQVGNEKQHEGRGLVLQATQAHVKDAVAALRRGQVVAVPTDTLYGLACDACSMAAVERIYEIKGRNANNPLAVCVADVDDLQRYAEVDHLPKGLLEDLLPGPVTLVLNRGDKSELEQSLNPGLMSIGIRIPDSEFIRLVARSFGGALALTSANSSSKPSTVRVEEFEHLWPLCAAVFDAGHLSAGRSGSTIVDITQSTTFKILRAGSALEETRAALFKHGLEEPK